MAPATCWVHHSHLWLVATLLVSVQRKHCHPRSKFYWTAPLYTFNVLLVHCHAIHHLLYFLQKQHPCHDAFLMTPGQKQPLPPPKSRT